MPKRRFSGYVWAAFKHHWNLLFMGAATALGFLSGHPEVVLPAAAAVELAYLGTTAKLPRFQSYVDNYVRGGKKSEDRRLWELLTGLSDEGKAEWLRLRQKCEGLDQSPWDAVAVEQWDGVNRLLWVHLKLLHTKQRLERFLDSTDEGELDRIWSDARRRLDAMGGTDAIADKKRRSLEDTIATVLARLENIKKARANYDYVKVELIRISTKLEGVVELAQNRYDAGAFTVEVDDAARSLSATEEMIGELRALTGLTQDDAQTPDILRRAAAAAQRARAGG